MELSGSCRCGHVKFTVISHSPCPYMRCYCSICRKTAGGGGFAINIAAEYDTLKVQGEEKLSKFNAMMPDENGGQEIPSSNSRYFCKHCGTAVYAHDPRWKEWCYPFASAIDTELPTPPQLCHIMLNSKAAWVKPEVGPNDECFDEYPELSIKEWHQKHGMFIE